MGLQDIAEKSQAREKLLSLARACYGPKLPRDSVFDVFQIEGMGQESTKTYLIVYDDVDANTWKLLYTEEDLSGPISGMEAISDELERRLYSVMLSKETDMELND